MTSERKDLQGTYQVPISSREGYSPHSETYPGLRSKTLPIGTGPTSGVKDTIITTLSGCAPVSSIEITVPRHTVIRESRENRVNDAEPLAIINEGSLFAPYCSTVL